MTCSIVRALVDPSLIQMPCLSKHRDGDWLFCEGRVKAIVASPDVGGRFGLVSALTLSSRIADAILGSIWVLIFMDEWVSLGVVHGCLFVTTCAARASALSAVDELLFRHQGRLVLEQLIGALHGSCG